MFCVFTTIEAVAGEQFEVFGVHSDQELSVIKSKLTEKFGKKWRCEDQRDDGGLKIFTCGGFNYFDANVYYDYTVERSCFKFSCHSYGGCGGDDALKQVRQFLEDRWNITFIY